MNDVNFWEKAWSKNSINPTNNFARRSYKLIKTKKLKTLLDLGCGLGSDSIYFSNKGLEVIAIDQSEKSIEILRKRNNKIKSIVKDIKDLKLRSNSIDVIYAHLSLHYFDDKTTTKIFNNLYRIMNKNGLFFVKCKSVEDKLFGKGEKIAENIYKETHLRHFFTKEYMEEKLEKFKIIKIRRTSSVYHEYKSSFIEAIATK